MSKMSHILPVAPPPPTPALVAHKIDIGSQLPICNHAKNQIDECLWALDYPELQKACYLARICQINPPRKCEYHNITGILQEGPTCGLTALSMLLKGTPTPRQLLAKAHEKRYTNNGEMFSALNLYQLICDHLQMTPYATTTLANNNKCGAPTSGDSSHCQLHEGRLNCTKVRECLQAGAYLFVPYPFQKFLQNRQAF